MHPNSWQSITNHQLLSYTCLFGMNYTLIQDSRILQLAGHRAISQDRGTPTRSSNINHSCDGVRLQTYDSEMNCFPSDNSNPSQRHSRHQWELRVQRAVQGVHQESVLHCSLLRLGLPRCVKEEPKAIPRVHEDPWGSHRAHICSFDWVPADVPSYLVLRRTGSSD